jgi:hypothetical protein
MSPTHHKSPHSNTTLPAFAGTSAHALAALQAVPSVGRKLISISLIVGAQMTLLQPVLFAALNATDPRRQAIRKKSRSIESD